MFGPGLEGFWGRQWSWEERHLFVQRVRELQERKWKSDHVTIPVKAPQWLPISLSKNESPNNDLGSLDLPRGVSLLAPSAPTALASLQQFRAFMLQFPLREGFPRAPPSPPQYIQLVCTSFPSGIYSDITLPVRSSLPPFLNTLYSLPHFIFLPTCYLPGNTEYILLIYLHLLSAFSKRNKSSWGQKFLSIGSLLYSCAWTVTGM